MNSRLTKHDEKFTLVTFKVNADKFFFYYIKFGGNNDDQE